MSFREYDHGKSLPEMEGRILAFWKEQNIFQKAVRARKRGRPFVFYEGPPTANAKPGIHHVLARVYKDVYIRYHSQKGHYVPRRAGWDCHGLPVEREVEKKLGINTKAEIEATVGLEEFNRLCRESILTYVADWARFTERMGFWIDLDDAYFTMHNEYMEAVWGLLKKIWERGLIYRDYKVVPYDPVMGATLSDAEVNLGYRTTEDPSVTVRFPVSGDRFGPNAFFLVWTTTPWTLPSNTALAVAPSEQYVVVERTRGEKETQPGLVERLIVAAPLREAAVGSEGTVVATVTGKDLAGARYERLFDWLPIPAEQDAFYVVTGDFVTMDTGSGIVHMAPAYGADDLEVGRRHNLPILHAVGLDGCFVSGTPHAGVFFKEADKPITRELRERGLLWKAATIHHEYPFGYRTGAPLIYYAKYAWYIRTTSIREELIANNRTIHWVPEHVREGRFGNWLENNRDWALSRERYWGTPLPLWTDDEGNYRMIGSVAELEKLCGRRLKNLDLHKPYIDSVEFSDPQTGRTMRRVPEVIDCWFDSGAMPYAQWGYPVRGRQTFESAFPADFITEAVDQTRGWFYTLLAIGTMVSDAAPYRNVICLGHVVDAKGEKMSKSKGNTVDPESVFSTYGADPLRWYFLTGAPPGNSRRVGQPGSDHDPVRVTLGFVKTLMSSAGFFTLYAAVDGISVSEKWDSAPIAGAPTFGRRPDIDRWILSSLQKLIVQVTDALDRFDSMEAGQAIEAFVEKLSNWYIRRNRRRFWKGEADRDKLAAYDTLYRALVTLARLCAPFMPFLAEDLYHELVVAPAARNKKKPPASVHLTDWPKPDRRMTDDAILVEGNHVLNAAYLGRAARKESGHKVRQPLARVLVHASTADARQAVERNREALLEEWNAKELTFLDDSAGILDYRARPNLPRLGKRLGPSIRHVQEYFQKTAGKEIASAVRAGKALTISTPGGPLELEPEDVLVDSVSQPGTSGAEGDGLLVAFDTQLTPELLAEGLVRDLVRNVQELRKNSGLEVTDRILLLVEGSPDVRAAVERFRAYVEEETLCRLVEAAAGQPLGQTSVQTDMGEAQLHLWKAGAN